MGQGGKRRSCQPKNLYVEIFQNEGVNNDTLKKTEAKRIHCQQTHTSKKIVKEVHKWKENSASLKLKQQKH